MLKILLVSATEAEIAPALKYLKQLTKPKEKVFRLNKIEVFCCITGVGMVNTAFELGKISNLTYDIAIQAGIAGSFGKQKKGDLVNITRDCFSELGAEDGKRFLSIDELKLGEQKVKLKKVLRNKTLQMIPEVKGITVNTVHGRKDTIEKIKKHLNPDVESMEGAAFMYAANQLGWKAIQLRSISNKVEKRNKKNWDIPLAIKNLNDKLIQLIKALNEN